MIDFSQVTDITYNGTAVEQIEDSLGNVLWSSTPAVLPNYFYVEDASGSLNTLSIKKASSSAPTIQVFKSTDCVNWTSMGSTSTTGITARIPANSKLYLKATATSWASSAVNTIKVSKEHNVGGNIMSLLYGDNFQNQTSFPSSQPSYRPFGSLFQNDTHLLSVSDLVLPATTLANYCYFQMFRYCTSLTTAPTLPATTLANYCYQYMFSGCESLTTAPTLPATTLASYCYHNMFSGCSSLTTAPALPATTLANRCYHQMFYGCTSLTTAPALPATTLAERCYNAMFENCTSLTTAPALPATIITDGCYASMFWGCTGLTTAPALPATTMANSCYYSMFQNCYTLTAAPALPATTLASACYRNMFQNCSALTSAPALPATTLADYCYYNMFSSCSSLNTVTTYAQDISADSCISFWLNYVAATGTLYNMGNANYLVNDVSGIPTGWTEISDRFEYFYVEDASGSSNTLSIKKTNVDAPTIEVFCSTDQTNWSSMGNTDTTAITATIPANGKLYLKATTNIWSDIPIAMRYNNIKASGNHNVGGNIMSLLYGDSFLSYTEFPTGTTFNFNQLFNNNNKLIDASKLIINYTLTEGCCYSMFYGCTSLTTAPALPATTLAEGCYYSMFQNCYALTAAPALPATTLAQACYYSMFENCTSLTTAPATLPATTLVSQCYNYMFKGCSALTSAPVLPATTLVYSCYESMFQNCSSLNTVTTYAQDISATNCLNQWLDNVAATGVFYNLGGATYTSGASGIPSGWTEHTSL